MVVLQTVLNETADFLVETLSKASISFMEAKSMVEVVHLTDSSDSSLFIIELPNKNKKLPMVLENFCKQTSQNGIPVVFVAQEIEDDYISYLLTLGISDVCLLPMAGTLFIRRIKNVLDTFKSKTDYINLASVSLTEIQEVQTVMIESLATLAEYRDPDTGEHIKRTQNYVKALALALMQKGYFKEELVPKNIDLMFMSVPLHDIGKVGIPDDILLKPGKLTTEEFELMKTHTILGHEALMKTGHKIKDNAFLRYAADVAYTHQEKYDGSGYPQGLVGENIPLIGRLMAVADVYDALTSKRVYKDAMPHAEAVSIIFKGSGVHFDPRIVEVFLDIESTFLNIAHTYRDAISSKSQPTELLNMQKNKNLNDILIVDDSRIIRTILRNQLERVGFKVDDVENGVMGLKKLKTMRYDLILTDLEMPRMNGYEFTKEAKKLIEPGTLVIVMTATDYGTSEKEVIDLGAHGLLLKPIELVSLEKKILEIRKMGH